MSLKKTQRFCLWLFKEVYSVNCYTFFTLPDNGFGFWSVGLYSIRKTEIIALYNTQ